MYSSYVKPVAIIASISSAVQCLIWISGYIVYVVTYACVLNPWDSKVTELTIANSLAEYVQGDMCKDSAWLQVLIVTTCSKGSMFPKDVLLSLMTVGLAVNITLLVCSCWVLRAASGGTYSVFHLYGSVRGLVGSILLASAWDVVLTALIAKDSYTITNTQCDVFYYALVTFYMLTCRGAIILLANVSFALYLLVSNRAPPFKKEVHPVSNNSTSSHRDSEIEKNDIAPVWTETEAPNGMMFGKRAPPHSALHRWPMLSKLGKAEDEPQLKDVTSRWIMSTGSSSPEAEREARPWRQEETLQEEVGRARVLPAISRQESLVLRSESFRRQQEDEPRREVGKVKVLPAVARQDSQVLQSESFQEVEPRREVAGKVKVLPAVARQDSQVLHSESFQEVEPRREVAGKVKVLPAVARQESAEPVRPKPVFRKESFRPLSAKEPEPKIEQGMFFKEVKLRPVRPRPEAKPPSDGGRRRSQSSDRERRSSREIDRRHSHSSDRERRSSKYFSLERSHSHSSDRERRSSKYSNLDRSHSPSSDRENKSPNSRHPERIPDRKSSGPKGPPPETSGAAKGRPGFAPPAPPVQPKFSDPPPLDRYISLEEALRTRGPLRPVKRPTIYTNL